MTEADAVDMLPALQRRSKEMAERLLNAGEQVFSEHGFKGTKLSDIAVAAHCSVGAVYSRFKDKEALFLAILQRFAAQSQAGVAAYFGAATATKTVSAAQTLHHFVVATGHSFRARHGMFRAIAEHGFDDAAAAAVILRLREQNEAVIVGFLRSHVPDAGDDLDFRVRVALQMLHGFLFLGLLNRGAPVPILSEAGLEAVAAATIATLGL